jgi:hypothetical protein
MAQQQQMASLFGPSIYDIEQQRMAQDQANALAQAKLTPYQSIRAGAAMAGTQAGRSIAGLFGVEDPKLKEASAMQELKNAINTQWDGQDPVDAYKIMAKEAARLGLTQQALGAAMQVKQAEEAKTMGELKRGLLEAQTGQAVARGKQAEAQALAAGKPKSSDLGALQAERNTLRTRMQNSTSPLEQEELRQQIAEIDAAITMKTTREAKDKTPPSVGQDREAIAQEIYNKGFYELTPDQKAVVNKRDAELAKGKQTINVDARQGQGINAAKVKRLDELEQAAVNADSSISNVSALSSVLGNAFTGVGSGAVLKAGQIANAFGVQVTGTSETEQLNQLLAKLAQGQARTLPGSLSEKELMFLREAIGTGGMTRQTLQAMLNRMRVDAIADKEAYKDAFAFQRSGGNLNDYDFATKRTDARRRAQRISELLDKATPEQRRQLGY